MARMALAILSALLALSPLASSRSLQTSDGVSSNGGCIASFTEGTNYFSTIFADAPFALPVALNTSIKNAYNFRVQYSDYYKVVKDTRTQTTYYLYLCGAPKPNVAAGAANGTFEIPLTGYGIKTTVPANYLQLLGTLDQLKSVDDSLVAPCLQQYAASLPQPPTTPVGAVIDASGAETFNQPNVSFSATQDEGVLNRAEWIKYMGLFFNKEDRAAAVFDNITAFYNCVKEAAPASGAKKTAAWLSFYDGMWTLSSAAFKKQFVADAGGMFPKEAEFGSVSYNMSVPENVTAFQSMLKGVDVVFDETYLATGPATYTFANFSTNAQLDTQEQGRLTGSVWSIYGTYNPVSNYTAWYESAISNPQVVLEEVLVALYPSLTPQGFTSTYFYDITNGKAKAVTAADCTTLDPTLALDPTPTFICGSKTAHPTTPAPGTPALGTPAAATPPPKGAASLARLTMGAAVLILSALLMGL